MPRFTQLPLEEVERRMCDAPTRGEVHDLAPLSLFPALTYFYSNIFTTNRTSIKNKVAKSTY